MEASTAEKPKTLPLFEGYRVTEHYLSFSGVKIEDLEVIEKLTLGQEVQLVVRGKVTGRAHKGKDDEAGNRTGAQANSVVTITSITSYDEE